ncbi:uncharacterized protein LOC116853072 [Odontomachus brunneus]|uniref:uncharacterized protein LOC116853072 n=1 Tax=Odontomachus brunneus TaxID=486640 RepID=UPI0013F2A9EA|nr:uncharacterized protein LOC116853072 [Odontomachus brunneus]
MPLKGSKMKILTIIVCALTIAMVYGINVERISKFNKNYVECCQREGLLSKSFHINAYKCALDMDGMIFNENGRVLKNAFLTFIEDVISHEGEMNWAKQLFMECYYEVKHPIERDSEEESNQICMCTLSILILFQSRE